MSPLPKLTAADCGWLKKPFALPEPPKLEAGPKAAFAAAGSSKRRTASVPTPVAVAILRIDSPRSPVRLLNTEYGPASRGAQPTTVGLDDRYSVEIDGSAWTFSGMIIRKCC